MKITQSELLEELLEGNTSQVLQYLKQEQASAQEVFGEDDLGGMVTAIEYLQEIIYEVYDIKRDNDQEIPSIVQALRKDLYELNNNLYTIL